MRKTLLSTFLLLLLVLTGCQNGQPKITGVIRDADTLTLYLERLDARKTVVLDSCRLRRSGKFAFTLPQKEYPELYRLRVGKEALTLVVDSTEHIQIETTKDSLSYTLSLTGSQHSLALTELRCALVSLPLDEYKQQASHLILQDPRSMVAYYALLTARNAQMVFDLTLPQDRKYFAAVATAWHTFYPNCERSKALYDLVLEVIQSERKAQSSAAWQDFLAQADNAFLDIVLPDENGVEQALSASLGKATLLVFSMTSMKGNTAYLFELRDLYNQYHGQGFEIYQVSADQDILLWSETAQNLPWTTVRGETGAHDKAFLTYNVSAVPTTFLFNAKGEIVGRDFSFEQLHGQIEKCLNGR